MEPLKALTFVVTAGVISLVGAGAAGFYFGYTQGRGSAGDGGEQIAVIPANGSGGTISLKPVLEDIRSLSKQVEELAAASKSGGEQGIGKSVADEIRALSRQIEGLKFASNGSSTASAHPIRSGPDYTEDLNAIRDQLKSLNTKFDKQEPKAPRALLDELRSLGATIQAQDQRRAIEEIRASVAILQNSEPRAPKAILDELRSISANLRAQEGRVAPSSVDQMKVLSAEVSRLQQLMESASDQFGRCQTLLGASNAGGNNAVTTVAQTVTRQEPSAVVFFDNVMLKKDQEKLYDEIGVRLSLQNVMPRQVRLAVNRQGVGLSFGEKKLFRSQNVECELSLMEINLNDGQARVSISCKR